MRNYQALYNALKRHVERDIYDSLVDCATGSTHDDIIRAQGRWSKVNDLRSIMDELEEAAAEDRITDTGEILERRE